MNPTTLLTIIAGTTTFLAVWLMIVTALIIKQNQFFTAFTKGVDKRDLKSVLQAIAIHLKKVTKEQTLTSQKIEKLYSDNKSHLQRVGLVRFNPYSDTGGNQSFVLCLLDERNNGSIITSLHSREQTRIYAKQVKGGVSDGIEFSKEEKEALKMAQKYPYPN